MRDRRAAPTRARRKITVILVILVITGIGFTTYYAGWLRSGHVHLAASGSADHQQVTLPASPSQTASSTPRPTARPRHRHRHRHPKPGHSPKATHSARPAPSSTPTPAPGTSSGPPPTHPKGCGLNPHACGYPDSTNTGVPAGTVLRKVPGQVTKGPGWHWDPRGWIVASRPGAVISNISVNATISVNAPNVTIKNSYVNCTGKCDFNIILRNTSTGAVANANNTVIENSTITDTSDTSASGIAGEGVFNTKVLRDNISNVATGVLFSGGSGLIENTYIHNLAVCCGYHNEDFQTTSDGNATLEHNTLFNQAGQTSNVQITQDFGPQSHVTVDNNLLAGGGWSIYGGDTGVGQSKPASYIRITNNRLSNLFFRKCGYYGWLTAFSSRAAGNVASGNIWDATGKPAH
jgi:hypothetical protein